MIKTLLLAGKAERDKFTIPRSVQQSIPIKRIYRDGIWQVGRKHSKTWRFADINYEAASDDDRRSIFLSYGGVLNSLPTDAAAKITICNQRLNPVDFERTILMREHGDKLDCYRREYNQILLDKMAQSNKLCQIGHILPAFVQQHAANCLCQRHSRGGAIDAREVFPGKREHILAPYQIAAALHWRAAAGQQQHTGRPQSQFFPCIAFHAFYASCLSLVS